VIARSLAVRPRGWAKHSFGACLTAAARRLHRNVLAAALANKLARIALTILIEARLVLPREHPIRIATINGYKT
jgi:hypothetical protein